MRKFLMIVVVAAAFTPALAEGQNWRTVTMSRQLQNNDEMRVEVEYGAGQLKIRSVDEGLMYRMNLRYDEDRFEPVADFSGDHLTLGIESLGRNRLKGRQSGEMDLELARGVPMRLDLQFGAVQAEIDLGGLALTDLELKTGASESTIDISEPNSEEMRSATFAVGAAEFRIQNLGNLNAERIEVEAGVGSLTLGLDGRWQRDARLSIDMGVGSLVLRVPEGLGIRLQKDSFLTSLDSQGLIKRGDVYESLDFEDADYKVMIDLDAAFGSVAVVWIR
ncbi:MAG: toast rack family protein [Gemmatimonadetes bacterium]|nr:toast rack family protein [Gemmatimonadota bacterium]MDA1104185.1 toast rack family protein [Gemmatimonadota bacterium]